MSNALFDATFLESQVTWTGAAFFVLLAIMWKFVVPSVTKVLDDRAERVKGDLDSASKMRDDAQATLAEYQKQLAAAKDEASNIINTARTEAQALVDERTAELEKELSRKMAAAEARIEQASTKAMEEIKTQVSDMVVTAAEKVISETIDAKKAEAITSSAIKDMLH